MQICLTVQNPNLRSSPWTNALAELLEKLRLHPLSPIIETCELLVCEDQLAALQNDSDDDTEGVESTCDDEYDEGELDDVSPLSVANLPNQLSNGY